MHNRFRPFQMENRFRFTCLNKPFIHVLKCSLSSSIVCGLFWYTYKIPHVSPNYKLGNGLFRTPALFFLYDGDLSNDVALLIDLEVFYNPVPYFVTHSVRFNLEIFHISGPGFHGSLCVTGIYEMTLLVIN